MSGIVSGSIRETIANVGTTLTVTLPPWESGDHVFVFISAVGSSHTAPTATGYTAIGTWSKTTNTSGQFHAKKQSSASASDSTVNFSIHATTYYYYAIAFVYRGADSSWLASVASGVDCYIRGSATATFGVNAADMSGYTAGSTMLVGIANANDVPMTYLDDFTAVKLGNSTQAYGVVGFKQLPASGTSSPAITGYRQAGAGNAQMAIVAVKNATGKSTPWCKPNITEVQWYGGNGVNNSAMNPTWSAPDGDTIAGQGTYTTAGSTATSFAQSNPDTGLQWNQCTYLDMNYTPAANQWCGTKHPFTTDLSDGVTGTTGRKLVHLTWYTSAAATTSLYGTKGWIVKFRDGSGNWAAYQLAATSEFISNTYRYAVIDVGNATKYDSSGTIDWSNLSSISYLGDAKSGAAGTRRIYVSNLLVIDPDNPATIIGGDSASPADLACYVAAHTQNNTYRLGFLQSTVQAMPLGSIQFGDGTNPTYLDTAGWSIGYPRKYNAITQNVWRVGEGVPTVSIKASADDTINMRAGVLVSDGLINFKIDAASDTGAASLFSGQAIIGATVTWKTGVNPTGITFQDCGQTDGKAAFFTQCNFTNGRVGTATGQLKMADGGKALSCVFTQGGSAAYAIKIDTAGDYYINGSTFSSGYTYHINITDSNPAHTVTIYKDAGDATPTYDTAGATVVIDTPTVTADISITGMPVTGGARRRLQIINQTAAAAATRANSTAYAVGDVRVRQTGVGSEATAGLYLRCTTGGTSAGSPPTWNTTPGGTTTDGTVVWTTYAVLYYDADPAAATLTDTYIDGAEFLAGEIVEVRFAEEDPAVAFATYSTSAVAASTGFSALVNEEAIDVYATYGLDGIDGDTVFSPDYAAGYIVLDTNTDFSGASAFAYYCYLLTTSDGMYRFWNGLTALDAGNIRNNVDTISLYFDESAGFVKQTDDVRIFRSDGARPAIDPTTGGNGIEINWRVPVNVVSISTASVLSPTESAKLMGLSNDVNVVQVAGVSVGGTGTDLDPWGPA